jgi:hypothetical protein
MRRASSISFVAARVLDRALVVLQHQADRGQHDREQQREHGEHGHAAGAAQEPGMSVTLQQDRGRERAEQARRHVQQALVEERALPAQEAPLERRHRRRARPPTATA